MSTNELALLFSGVLLLLFCVVPVAWAWVARSDHRTAVRLRQHPRFFIAGALLGWSFWLSGQFLNAPIIGAIGAVATLVLVLGGIILFGKQIYESKF